MRLLKSSISQRRQQSTDTHQLEIQTPSKHKQASVTQSNFFSPSSNFSSISNHINKGFGQNATNYKGSSFYSASQKLQHVNSQDQGLRDTILLNSQQKKRAIQHLSGGTESAKQQQSNHKLNFLGSTNKNQYVDIKTKRVNDLNTLYNEGSNTDFNSQNVFMNKLVYHTSGGNPLQPISSPPNKKSMSINIGSIENKVQQSIESYQNLQLSADRYSRNSNRENVKLPLTTRRQQFDGLENFVKTMYKTGNTDFYKSGSSYSFNNNSNVMQQTFKPNRDYEETWNSGTTGFLEDQEQNISRPNQYKSKDLFITKLSNTFITPKYIYYQSKPSSEKFKKRNSLLDNNSNPYNTVSQSKLENPAYLSSFLNGNQVSVERLNSQESQKYKYRQNSKFEEIAQTNIPPLSYFQLDDRQSISRNEQIETQQSKENDTKSKKKYNYSMQTSMMTEFILPDVINWDVEYLFVFINNLSQVKRKNNLKYVFLPLPQVENLMSEKKLNIDYITLKEQIKTRLQINSKDIYLFLDDGTPIKNHMDIVKSQNKERRAIFAGGCGGFCGISNLFIPHDMKQNLIKVINGLIEQNFKLQEKNYQKNEYQNQNNLEITRPSSQSSNSIRSNQQLMNRQNSQKNMSEVRQEEFQTKEQHLKKQNKQIVDRVVNILTHNPKARIKRFEESQDNPRIRQLQKIENLYDKQLSEFKKQALEVEASSSLGDNPEKQQTKNLRQIAEFIDEFFEKNNSKQNQTIKHTEDQYSSLVNNMLQKPQEKRNFIKENIERFNSPQMAMKYIQNLNRELFVKNIPKILAKYELSRHDLHSIYILYKALLTVSIQRIDWKDASKGGIDFKTFEHGIDKISSQSEEIIKRMCNFENFINWNQFIDILYAVSGKTLESKIDIFIKVADTDRGGTLSREEISELCYICLDKIIPTEGEDDSMVKDLVEYFTRLLFDSLDVESDEIPLHKLKNAIIQGHPENDLLCFFCGVEYSK